jgi:hypothetical protein
LENLYEFLLKFLGHVRGKTTWRKTHKNSKMKKKQILTILVIYFGICSAWRSNDKILLDEVKALTLEAGKMTTGKRSSPVSQLTCIGGTAIGHTDLYPKIVQV